MKTALITALILLVVGALLFGAGFVLLQGNPIKKNTLYDVVKAYPVSEAPQKINIETIDSRVEILPIEGDEWRVEIKETKYAPHTVELTEGVLTIKQTSTSYKWYEYINVFNGFQSTSVIVYLPVQTYEELSIHSVSSRIQVQEGFVFSNASLQNTSGFILWNSRTEGDLIVTNTSGSIHIAGGVGGKLEVRNVSGSIQIKNVTPTSVTVKNTSGGIDLINVVCSDSCEIENGSSSIELENCDAASFHLKTVSGGIRASILSGKTFDCRSTSGGVNVPENQEGGAFYARSTSGGIRVTVAE